MVGLRFFFFFNSKLSATYVILAPIFFKASLDAHAARWILTLISRAQATDWNTAEVGKQIRDLSPVHAV